MAIRVFFAWQSDRPNNVCRNFIRKALDKAATEINATLDIEYADRRVEIDQDTQDVAGSPSIAETILEKIRNCDVFVPDLTLIAAEKDTRCTPNPNVLIEYGYALHALGDERIIGVFNEAFGPVEDLPFDIRHKRWPIRYNVAPDYGVSEPFTQKNSAREKLTRDLVKALETFLRNYAESEGHHEEVDINSQNANRNVTQSTTAPAGGLLTDSHFAIAQTQTIAEQYPWENGVVGIRISNGRDRKENEVRLIGGPSIFLNLKPRSLGNTLTNVETMEITQSVLQPLAAHRSRGWSSARNRHGGAVFSSDNKSPNRAFTASMLIRTGELHGIDCSHLQVHKRREMEDDPYIPTGAVEEILVDGLIHFLEVAKNNLDLELPLDAVAGFEGITEFRLAVDPKFFYGDKYVGHIFDNSVGKQFKITDYDCDVFEILLPLFDELYDRAGVRRPPTRRVGRSQR